MGSMSNDLENKILDHVLGSKSGGTAYVAVDHFIALFTAAPSDTGGGTEVTGGSYARVSYTNTAAHWPAAASGSKSNGTTITFAVPTADWSSGASITHFGIMTSSGTATAASDFCYWGALTTSKTVLNGAGAPTFASGALVVTQD